MCDILQEHEKKKKREREGNSAPDSFQFKAGYNRRMQMEGQDNGETVTRIICWISDNTKVNVTQKNNEIFLGDCKTYESVIREDGNSK